MRLSVLNVIGRTSPSSCSLVPEGLTPGPARRGCSSPAAGLSWVVIHYGRYRLTTSIGSQCVSYFLCGLFPALQGRLPLSCGGPQPVPVALVAQPVSECRGEGSRIAGRDQLTGAGAVGGGAERFGQPADGGSYDGQAVGERFGGGHAVGLRAGRRDGQVGGGIARGPP